MTSVLFDIPGEQAARRYRTAGVVSSVVLAALLGLLGWRLATKGQLDPEQWEFLTDPDILEALFVTGLRRTLTAAFVAVAIALLFGAVFAIARLSEKPYLRWPATVVIEFFRAVPLVLLILFIFLGYGDVFGRFGSLVLALVLYNGSVLAEIFRAGIASVPRGQGEAAMALGMSKGQVMRLVLVPQAVRAMLPAIISQSVVALKDTALGFIISSREIVSVGKQIYVGEGNPLQVGIVLAAIFIAINYALSRVAVYFEGRQRRVRPTLAEEGGPGPGMPPSRQESGIGQPGY